MKDVPNVIQAKIKSKSVKETRKDRVRLDIGLEVDGRDRGGTSLIIEKDGSIHE